MGWITTSAHWKKDVFFYYFYIDIIFYAMYNKTTLKQGGTK